MSNDPACESILENGVENDAQIFIRQFLTRGKTNVAAEVALIFLCYNLKRLRKIMTQNPIMNGAFPRLRAV